MTSVLNKEALDIYRYIHAVEIATELKGSSLKDKTKCSNLIVD